MSYIKIPVRQKCTYARIEQMVAGTLFLQPAELFHSRASKSAQTELSPISPPTGSSILGMFFGWLKLPPDNDCNASLPRVRKGRILLELCSETYEMA